MPASRALKAAASASRSARRSSTRRSTSARQPRASSSRARASASPCSSRARSASSVPAPAWSRAISSRARCRSSSSARRAASASAFAAARASSAARAVARARWRSASLGEQRARALLQLRHLVARALLLVLERLDCALGAGERGAGALGLRVRGGACLLSGPGSGQRPLEVVLVCRRRALAGGVQPLLGALHALARLAQSGSQLLPLALGRLHPLALAGGRGFGLREARHQALDLGRALRAARLVHRGLGPRPPRPRRHPPPQPR